MDRYGLLARRTADQPNYRVAAQETTRPTRLSNGAAKFAPAALMPEPLAFKNARPGDTPTDFQPEIVPYDDRTPYPAGDLGPTDLDYIAHARAIATTLRSRGAVSTDMQGQLLDDLDLLLAGPQPANPETVDGKLIELLDELTDEERGFEPELADAIEENINAIADLGFREPLDVIYPADDYDAGDDEPY